MIFEIEHLTDQEVRFLINDLKIAKEIIPPELPLWGKIKDDTLIQGTINSIEYQLHRYRHPIDNTRFSISLRFLKSNDMLIRLDINNGTHKNPDGTQAPNNHLHIYKDNNTNKKDAFAYPIPGEFKNIGDIFEALEDFLSYNNVTVNQL